VNTKVIIEFSKKKKLSTGRCRLSHVRRGDYQGRQRDFKGMTWDWIARGAPRGSREPLCVSAIIIICGIVDLQWPRKIASCKKHV